jgi:hypothetical protein
VLTRKIWHFTGLRIKKKESKTKAIQHFDAFLQRLLSYLLKFNINKFQMNEKSPNPPYIFTKTLLILFFGNFSGNFKNKVLFFPKLIRKGTKKIFKLCLIQT